MTLEDIARLKLEIDAASSKESLEDLKLLGKQINAELRDMEAAGEKGSDAWQQLKTAQKEVNSEIREMARNIDINNASMNELTAASRQLNRDLNQLTIGTEEWLEKMAKLREVNEKIDDVKKQVRGIKEEAEEQDGFWTRFKSNLAAAFTFDAIKEAAEAIYDFGKEVLETTAKFEKYNAILETTLGSSKAAAAAFDMIQTFAAKTNFSVDELTDSYIKLANRGLRPTQNELTAMADFTNKTGKSFEQLVEAINDVNNPTRWSELGGTKVQTAGDRVKLTFNNMTKEVQRTEAGVMSAIVAFGQMNGVAGMTEKISKTLEGQVSNLGDAYDQLKVLIGNELKGAFSTIITILGQAIISFGELWKGTSSVRDVFGMLWNSIGTLLTSFTTLIKSYWNLDDKMSGTNVVALILNTAFQILGSGIQILIAFLTAGVDAFNIMLNKGKEVANFFGANFKIDPKASFDTLKKNFSDNTQAIKKIWDDTEKGREEKTNSANDSILKSLTQSQNQATTQAKEEAKKQAEARQKAEEEAQKKIDDMRVAAIKDETQRQIAAENLRFEREQEAIRKSLATDKTKKEQLSLAETIHQDNLTKINTTAEEKRTKEASDNAQKLAVLKAKLSNDELQVKIANLEKAKAEDETYIRKTVTDETQKAELLRQLNDKFLSDVDAAKKKQQDEEAKRNKAHRDQQFKEEKELFDNTYQAEIAKANLSLELTKNNAQQQYQAKLNLLELEAKYKTAKLQREAAEEKARIEESIQDTDRRKQSIEAIDARLTAQLKENETKLQADKVQIQEEANKKRQENNKQFFDALNGLMKGDYTAFMGFLNDKLKNDAAKNQKQLQDFTQKGQETLEVAAQVVGSLQILNQKYLDSQLAKIKKEKDNQLSSWKAQYDAGIISKDQYEKKVDQINKEAAEKEKAEKIKAWKRDQTMQIAMALINAAMAALKSMATMGFPLGLIGVAASAAMAAVQIGIIKSQKPPEYRRGGYVQNAGIPIGPRHGREYGDSGISLVRRDTGEEVGEMEGDEPIMILSRNTYRNNKPVIDRLLHSSLHQNGAKIFRNGGITGSDGGSYDNYLQPTRFGRMYMNGTDVNDTGDSSGGGSSYTQSDYQASQNSTDDSGYSGTTGGSMAETVAMTDGQIEKSQQLMADIADNTKATVAGIDNVIGTLQTISSKLDTSNSYLSVIAAKNLSISVQNIINVNNQIDVVVDASNFK